LHRTKPVAQHASVVVSEFGRGRRDQASECRDELARLGKVDLVVAMF